jgi:DUF2975 family protein
MMAIAGNRMNTIQRTSRTLRAFFVLLAVLVAMGLIAKWLHPIPHEVKTIAGVAFEGAALTGKIQTLWLVQTLLGAALNLKVVYHIVTLLGLYSKGKLFTEANVSQIRQLGLTMMFGLVIWLIGLIGAGPEILAAQDQWVKIMPSFPGGAIINGGLMVYVSWIVNEGRLMRDEQDLVV